MDQSTATAPPIALSLAIPISPSASASICAVLSPRSPSPLSALSSSRSIADSSSFPLPHPASSPSSTVFIPSLSAPSSANNPPLSPFTSRSSPVRSVFDDPDPAFQSLLSHGLSTEESLKHFAALFGNFFFFNRAVKEKLISVTAEPMREFYPAKNNSNKRRQQQQEAEEQQEEDQDKYSIEGLDELSDLIQDDQPVDDVPSDAAPQSTADLLSSLLPAPLSVGHSIWSAVRFFNSIRQKVGAPAQHYRRTLRRHETVQEALNKFWAACRLSSTDPDSGLLLRSGFVEFHLALHRALARSYDESYAVTLAHLDFSRLALVRVSSIAANEPSIDKSTFLNHLFELVDSFVLSCDLDDYAALLNAVYHLITRPSKGQSQRSTLRRSYLPVPLIQPLRIALKPPKQKAGPVNLKARHSLIVPGSGSGAPSPSQLAQKRFSLSPLPSPSVNSSLAALGVIPNLRSSSPAAASKPLPPPSPSSSSPLADDSPPFIPLDPQYYRSADRFPNLLERKKLLVVKWAVVTEFIQGGLELQKNTKTDKNEENQTKLQSNQVITTLTDGNTPAPTHTDADVSAAPSSAVRARREVASIVVGDSAAAGSTVVKRYYLAQPALSRPLRHWQKVKQFVLPTRFHPLSVESEHYQRIAEQVRKLLFQKAIEGKLLGQQPQPQQQQTKGKPAQAAGKAKQQARNKATQSSKPDKSSSGGAQTKLNTASLSFAPAAAALPSTERPILDSEDADEPISPPGSDEESAEEESEAETDEQESEQSESQSETENENDLDKKRKQQLLAMVDAQLGMEAEEAENQQTSGGSQTSEAKLSKPMGPGAHRTAEPAASGAKTEPLSASPLPPSVDASVVPSSNVVSVPAAVPSDILSSPSASSDADARTFPPSFIALLDSSGVSLSSLTFYSVPASSLFPSDSLIVTQTLGGRTNVNGLLERSRAIFRAAEQFTAAERQAIVDHLASAASHSRMVRNAAEEPAKEAKLISSSTVNLTLDAPAGTPNRSFPSVSASPMFAAPPPVSSPPSHTSVFPGPSFQSPALSTSDILHSFHGKKSKLLSSLPSGQRDQSAGGLFLVQGKSLNQRTTSSSSASVSVSVSLSPSGAVSGPALIPAVESSPISSPSLPLSLAPVRVFSPSTSSPSLFSPVRRSEAVYKAALNEIEAQVKAAVKRKEKEKEKTLKHTKSEPAINRIESAINLPAVQKPDGQLKARQLAHSTSASEPVSLPLQPAAGVSLTKLVRPHFSTEYVSFVSAYKSPNPAAQPSAPQPSQLPVGAAAAESVSVSDYIKLLKAKRTLQPPPQKKKLLKSLQPTQY